jgi:class 3 adenylate cyclase
VQASSAFAAVGQGDEGEEHPDALVVMLDVVDFTATCAALEPRRVLAWMRAVRRAIEAELVACGLRLIETRGDNYLAVATAADGPRPATRALAFAARAARAAHAVHGTRIRVGVARGPLAIARLDCCADAAAAGSCHGGGAGRARGVLCAFGDVVNVAGRLEQSGGADFVHVAEEAAVAFAAEGGLAGPPPVGRVAAKGKAGGVRSARWDWRRGGFEAPPAAGEWALAPTAPPCGPGAAGRVEGDSLRHSHCH